MNILIFIHSLSSGGAERVTVNLANQWAKRGWTITIVTMSGENLDFYSIDQRIRRISINQTNIGTNLAVGIFNNLRRIHSLRKVLIEINPDIAIGMMTTANILLCLASFGLAPIKTIVSERNYPPAMKISRHWEWMRKWVYHRASRVVMQTQEGLDWLNKMIPKATGRVIPNPFFYPLTDSDPIIKPDNIVSNERNIILAVGRLMAQKRLDNLIDAFSKLESKHTEWDLIIIGEGPLRNELEKQVCRLELQSRIKLPGRAGNISEWYHRADLYAMSSHFEGFPNTLGEAMTHGCAAVSFDCDTGPRDLIIQGTSGLLVRPVGDVQALARALDKVMSDEKKRLIMSVNAKSVLDRYSMNNILLMWDKLFSEVGL